ncbi:flap endonuclease GEN homolog 1 [Aulostomus maculatus]
MGVHDLWSIVEPVRESVSLYSLSGKTLAVDLSLWVCEAQHVQAMIGRVSRPHLRNLFFRVSSLTLMGVKLVFVMEGEAPKLKAQTMSLRTEKRFVRFKKAAAPPPQSNTGRGRFKAVLRECAEMLDYLGVPWVTAAGEAEAMCAYLDSQGLVDGCITNDGDAFLYGAQTVYRNFNMNSKDPQVDCYKISHVQTELHLSRENLVGLAILLGCDYIPKGIPGVGREQALKLIQTLKGQTLLQRFTQWKEETAGVSEGAVKKVPHCYICRHPGSLKAHKHGGCTFCDSKQFCQPHDVDYQCPCDWHLHERTRQASTVEANVKKKTLASPQFPFTEIICEFLVSRDQPVSNFKRRQPNLQSMQNFAYDKMEWPKHYTSEKVLVLMTYAELMNRKYGRQMTSQIKPLRIFKPRVRNAVTCFEVIWSTPDHFIFPEDRPVEDQHEVRTVEEEALFRVAHPEVVESYLRDKAQAEDSKTKKKKPKSTKVKTSDEAGISDLLAQMTLLPAVSNTNQPDVVILDTPVNHKLHREHKEDRRDLVDGPNNFPLSQPESLPSPSVSAVIDALHLSNIDWDGLSFTSSPPPQTNHTTETKTSNTAESEQKTCRDLKPAPERCYTECSLWDRVLMRNTVQVSNQNGKISKEVTYESSCPQHVSPLNSTLDSQISIKDRCDLELSGKNPLPEVQSGPSKAETDAQKFKRQHMPAVQAQSKTTDKCQDSRRPAQKYKFVRNAPMQRCHSESYNKDKKIPQNTKKSVCKSVCSSSEESDVENQQFGPQKKTKIKPANKLKSSLLLEFPLKPVSKATAQPASKQQTGLAAASKSSRQDVPAGSVEAEVFLQSPASPIIVVDSDDSVVCGESPLPLAERLRLRLLK